MIFASFRKIVSWNEIREISVIVVEMTSGVRTLAING
jgi:hypothetical protein